MKDPKEYDWLKRNRKYLNIKAIADEVGVSVRILSGYASEQADGHGTPYKVAETHKAKLIELIQQICTTKPKPKKK